MKNSTKKITIWVLSFFLMVLFVIYQRATGPTYPISGKVEVNSQKIKYKLPRTHGGPGPEVIKIEVPDKSINGIITLKRFKSHDEWTTTAMKREGDFLTAEVPHQPPAGKIIYAVSLVEQNGKITKLGEKTPIIRFKGDVPMYFLIPHIIFIFTSMWFSTAAGMSAFTNTGNYQKLALVTMVLLFLSGAVFGPLIQKYAFGFLWTGWPIADGQNIDFLKVGDLTDNKTFVALIMWTIAFFKLRKNPQAKGWVIAAALTLIAVFLIPHSVLGSEIDYTKAGN